MGDIHQDQHSQHSNRLNEIYLAKEKFIHIIKAARSATAANILAPLLCIPAFRGEIHETYFYAWLAYMTVAVAVRSYIIYSMAYEVDKIENPHRDLKRIAFAIGIVGLGWGLGWPLITPYLSMVNRMIYVYMTTAAMIAGMFAYSVDWRAFYSFTLPIMLPALSTLLWPENIFPWPFVVGLTAFYFVVLSIARNFSKLFSESVKLKFGNQQLYQELAAERDESIAANISKSKFIAVASHDLRQPLHAVNINIELFDLSDLSQKNFNIVRKIKNSMMGLNNMFEALLNMSKLDSFASSVSKDYFEVHELTDAIRDVVESRAVAKGLMFSINRPSFVVHGDKLLLQQLLVNLVMNAIQYTDRGQVEVVFANQMGHLVVDVIDTGVGISAEDQINIFNEFFRAKNTRDSHEGLGLGLSIVRRLCRLMDMSISLDSKTGEGSRFTLTTHHQVIHENQPVKPVSMVSSDQGHKDRTLAGKVIAIIEDDEVIVDAYRQTLLAKGATIVVLSEQDEELQLQLEAIDQIDCILSDYRLKNTNGIALIEKIRENFNSDIPAVIVTGDVSPENIKAFKGFNAIVLHKPLTLAKISESMIAVIHGV